MKTTSRSPFRTVSLVGIFATAIFVVAMIVWQGIAVHGAPDPMQPNTSPTVAFLDIGVLVFREGLECILVLAAITASMTGAKQAHRRPIAAGAAIAFGATLITWMIAIRIVSSLSDNMPALDLQAGSNAGAGWVIGVLSGAHDAETLGKTPHTHLLPSFADLPGLLGID